MLTVNTLDAKTRLSELLRLVEEQGETVLVCRHGRPVAELRAPSPARDPFAPHPLLRQVRFTPDVDAPAEPAGWEPGPV
jgi:antitoxin (DNA-binding transcriptional repressor) of toxin-antitoxin stability system